MLHTKLPSDASNLNKTRDIFYFCCYKLQLLKQSSTQAWAFQNIETDRNEEIH